ncbi:phage major capsid protein [Bifidobacterium sp. SO4]|uniref:phage major capsid protein n=1 Tax=Bifidobacterium sp. SO4 TaxID=2809030 RepID=UPI001BDD05DF|nr:phage major capsid protein [Bifidobacterium sp. SO4]MBT1169601.1 phage major capsid protein [Bifidobacterium sp. SO4]
MATPTDILTSHGTRLQDRIAFSEIVFPAVEHIPDALIFSQSKPVTMEIKSEAGSVSVPFVPELPASQIIEEGQEIPESAAQINSLNIFTFKITSLVTATNESVEYDNNASKIQTLLTWQMDKSVTNKADAVFLQNAPNEDANGIPDGPIGLFNLKGITQGGEIANGEGITNALQNGLSVLVDALAKVSAKGAKPTSLIMNFGTWAQLLNLQYADYRPMISPDVANAPIPMLYGLPVVINNAAPDNKILINDANVVYSAITDMRVSSSAHSKFSRDATQFRVTFRFGFGCTNPERLAVVSVYNPVPPKAKTTKA